MKSLILLLSTCLSAAVVSADVIQLKTEKCEDNQVSLNTVYEMRTYSNSQIKVFSIDTIEPAAVPVSLAITLDRGEDLSTYESYCRRISYISSIASLSSMKSSFDAKTNVLSLEIKIQQMTEDGDFVPKTLKVRVNKSAQREEDIVQAMTQ